MLVDEFQDTDPLQAEILHLLASDPDTNGNDWRNVVPRPGALFVVGDPKQSIYRFRRADISLYEAVKQRFAEFGEVLSLEANFRSVNDFGTLVHEVFNRPSRFPENASDLQASFAPLLPRTGGRGLLTTYPVVGKTQGEAAAEDAARIASEIARRVASGRAQGRGLHDPDRHSPLPVGLCKGARGSGPAGRVVRRRRGALKTSCARFCCCFDALPIPSTRFLCLPC